MRKTLIIGVLLCAFLLCSIPSINAIESKKIIEEEKPENNYKTKIAKLFSTIKESENEEHPKIFFSTSILIAGIALTVVIAALIYIYCSGMITPDPDSPLIEFSVDNTNDTIIVISTEPNILWSDIEIQGDCDKSGLSVYVKVGDEIKDCNGEIRLIYKPTDSLLGVYNFY